MKRNTSFVKINYLNFMAIGMCAIFCLLLILQSGIIPGMNPKADIIKKDLKSYYNRGKQQEGIIEDRYCEILINADKKGEEAECKYPIAYGWLIGYQSEQYGGIGLRQMYKDILWNDERHTMQLTIDSSMQVYAYELLDQLTNDGCIIILNNQTGEIITFVSKSPVTLNINDIPAFLKEANTVEGSMLWRGIAIHHPPGSTWKLITAAVALENDITNFDYYDEGGFTTIDGNTIYNFDKKDYGLLDLATALKYSSNTYFAQLGLQVGDRILKEKADKLLFNQIIQLDFASITSNYEIDHSEFLTAQTAFGQGKIELTPLHLAMIYQSFANEGRMMKPYVVSSIKTADGLIFEAEEQEISQPFTEETAKVIRSVAHVAALSYGYNEQSHGYVFAKTGTAELSNGNQSYIIACNKKYTYLISDADAESSNDLLHAMNNLLLKYQ